jgi:hypothetical protein
VGSEFNVTVGVEVTVNPTVLAQASNVTVCKNEDAALSLNLSNVYSTHEVVWMLGATEIDRNTDVAAPANGMETLTATVSQDHFTACSDVLHYSISYTDNSGCTASTGADIIVRVPEWHVTAAAGATTVACINDAVAPHTLTDFEMPTVTDGCGMACSYGENPQVTTTGENCDGTVTYTYTYTACDNTTGTWTYTYTVKDNVNPVIASGFAQEVSATRQGCAFLVPDFTSTVRQYASDNCTARENLIINQVPSANSTITESQDVTVTVKDACGNSAEAVIRVTAEGALTISIDTVDAGCQGQNDGFVQFTVDGSSTRYFWDIYTNTSPSQNVDGGRIQQSHATVTSDDLADGVYRLEVEDVSNNCTVETTFEIKAMTQQLLVTAASDEWTYDATAHNAPSYKVQLDNAVIGENVASGNAVTLPNGDVLTATVEGTITNVGTADNTVSGITVMRGTSDVTCKYITTLATGTLTITPAAVTVTADAATKVYGEEDPVFTGTVAGLLNGESEDLIDYTMSRQAGEDVGTYTITPAG